METLPGIKPQIKSLLYDDFQKVDLCCVTRTTGKEQDLGYRELKCHLISGMKGVVVRMPGVRMEEMSENGLALGWAPTVQVPLSNLLHLEGQEHCLLVRSRTIQATRSEASTDKVVFPRKGLWTAVTVLSGSRVPG